MLQHIRTVDRIHTLSINTSNDSTVLLDISVAPDAPILTFDSSLNCTDSAGVQVGRITVNTKDEYVVESPLGIETTPVPMGLVEGIFKVEVEFCQKYLERNI